MNSSWRIGLVAVFAVTTIAACGETAGSDWVPPSGTPASTPAASAPAADRPAAITAACPLLPADEVVRVLGGTKQTRLQATEGATETAADGARFTCAYGRDGRQALALAVTEQAGTPDAGVDAVVEQSGATAKEIPGLGDTAVTYATQDFRYVAVAVSHDEGHRLVLLGAPAIVPAAKLTELATGLVRRV